MRNVLRIMYQVLCIRKKIHNTYYIHATEKGYIAITMILVLMSVVLGVTATVTLLGIGEGQSAFALTQGESTLGFVEECVEDALNRAKLSTSFASSPPLTITELEGTCTISKLGSNWTISTQATTYNRKIQATFTTDGYGVTLTSWTEI